MWQQVKRILFCFVAPKETAVGNVLGGSFYIGIISNDFVILIEGIFVVASSTCSG